MLTVRKQCIQRNGSNLEEIVNGFIGGLLKPPPSYVPQNVPRRYTLQELTTLHSSGQPTKKWVHIDELYQSCSVVQVTGATSWCHELVPNGAKICPSGEKHFLNGIPTHG